MAEIPVELCVGARELTEPRLSPDGQLVAWAESRQGTARLLAQPVTGGEARAIADTPPPRTGRGLGGGCWCWSGRDRLIHAAVDGNLWEVALDGSPPRPVTDHDRVAQAPAVSPNGRHLVYVVDQSEVWSPSGRLDDGTDEFCFDPDIDDTGRVVWQAWSAPDMPWDAAHVADAGISRFGVEHRRGAGAIQQPRLCDGALLTVRDDTGWANVWLDGRPLVDEPCEHAGPTWGLGQRSYAVSPDGRSVAFTRNERGFGRLCVVDVGTGHVREVARGVHGQLSWRGSWIAALRSGARTPTQIVVYDASDDFARRIVDVGPHSGWDAVALVEPDVVEIGGIPARLYRADNETGRLICWIHGGPTDQWQVTFMPRVAYWRSRGWNVLVPDHHGSTGSGRAFQQALRGNWGELDVTDTIAALAAAHERGWGTPERTVLMGGSSGGFTVLSVLARSDRPRVAAGVVSYPVTDLADLEERSHRFERHYTRTLVDRSQYAQRSPVTFAERITVPLLVFHGSDDPVVPLEQSQALVDRMRAAGADVDLVVYQGEGHGFRNADNQIDEYRRIGAFLSEHVPADSVAS